MKFYFVVNTESNEILRIVQRNTTPQETNTNYFVVADTVLMTFYHRLLQTQDVVTIDDVLTYGNQVIVE